MLLLKPRYLYYPTILSNFSPSLRTYSFIRSDRVYGIGGGVGIMIHNHIRIILLNCLIF